MYNTKVRWILFLASTYFLVLLKTSLALPRDCTELRSSSGILESPVSSTSKSYHNNLDVCWKITVARDKYVLLQSFYFELDAQDPCKDWLKVSDYKDQLTSATPLCGTINETYIESMENTLFLHFTTDDSITRKGFKLKWTSMSNGKKNEDLIDLCPYIMSEGVCEKYPTAMEWNCRKTCKGSPVKDTPKKECGKVYIPSANKIAGGINAPSDKYTPTDRITKGFDVPNHKYPWQVGLRYPSSFDKYFCGGSIINSDYILTAAHCFYMYSGYPGCKLDLRSSILQIGIADTDQRDPFDGGFFVYADYVIIHPQWNCMTNQFDFALLKLEQSLDLENHEYIAPVCLPENDEKTYENMTGTVSGWGNTQEGPETVVTSDILKETTVNIMDINCGNYTSTPIFPESMCAGTTGISDGKDSCQGDSGGPLTIEENGRMIQVGVVSHGRGCGESHFPGIYARVSKVLDWINNPTENRHKLFKTSWVNIYTADELDMLQELADMQNGTDIANILKDFSNNL